MTPKDPQDDTKSRQDKTKQDKTKQDKTRQDKTREEKRREKKEKTKTRTKTKPRQRQDKAKARQRQDIDNKEKANARPARQPKKSYITPQRPTNRRRGRRASVSPLSLPAPSDLTTDALTPPPRPTKTRPFQTSRP